MTQITKYASILIKIFYLDASESTCHHLSSHRRHTSTAPPNAFSVNRVFQVRDSVRKAYLIYIIYSYCSFYQLSSLVYYIITSILYIKSSTRHLPVHSADLCIMLGEILPVCFFLCHTTNYSPCVLGSLVISVYAVCPDITATVTPDLENPDDKGQDFVNLYHFLPLISKTDHHCVHLSHTLSSFLRCASVCACELR